MRCKHGIAALVGLGFAGFAGMAEAGLRVCNKTGLLQSVAIGYKGDTDWTSEGWWNIGPGDCATLVTGDLTKRYYYYYAESEGREFQSQNYEFCTRDEEFTIVGDTDCEARGFDVERFREVDTGETAVDFTLSLVANGLPQPAGGAEDTPTAIGPGGGGGSQDTSLAPEQTPVTVRPEDLESGLPAGGNGEPISVRALFQGCELEDGKPYCGFHAQGQKLRAYYSGPTPEGLMFALETMELNTPVRLQADRVETRGLHSAVVLREVVADPAGDSAAALRRAMQGDWVSDRDARIGFTIRGSELYTRYNGEFRGTRFLRIAETCDAARGKGPVLLQTRLSTRQQACYVIDRMTEGVMELTEPVGGIALRYVAKR